MIELLKTHFFQIGTIALFGIGFMTLLLNDNLIRKIIGLNIMDTSVFLFFITIGYAEGKDAPIISGAFKGFQSYITPIPAGLMLTGIVVAVSSTAFALALTIKFYEHYGTVDLSEIMELKGD